MLIDRKEALRYMGFRSGEPDEQIEKLMEECIKEIEEYADPRHIIRRFELEIEADYLVKAGGITLASRNLAKNLKGCHEVYFMAATLGNGPDRLMNRYSRLQISKAAVLQGVAAAAIEGYCNECQQALSDELEAEGLYLRPRFSPGYGDLSLSVQPDFLAVLNASKTVGIILSEGGVMIPVKSVTAIIGVSKDNTRCHIEGCESCGRTDCAYKR